MTYANPSALVSTDWLNGHLEDPSIRIIEVDEDTSLYETDHIPGAIAWSWSDDLHHPVRRDYLDQDGLQRAALGGRRRAREHGRSLRRQQQLVRCLRLLAAQVPGLRQREAPRRRPKEVATGVPSPGERAALDHTSDYAIAGQERPEIRAYRDDVIGRQETATLIDVRSPEEFSGQKLAPDHLPQEQPYVAGHVPGARNIPWGKAANEDGTFKSLDELTELYGAESTVVR